MPSQTPLSELLLGLKGHMIDEIAVTEDKDGIHVEMKSTKRSELEPDNDMAVTFSHWSFIIREDKCEECRWTFTDKNERFHIVERPAKPGSTG